MFDDCAELWETGLEFDTKVCSMRAMSLFSTNPITNCLCNVNLVTNGMDEAFGLRWA